jgi:hypothetical protein
MRLKNLMRINPRGALFVSTAAMFVVPFGCARLALEGGEKPIHIVMDVNVRVQNELEDFYSFRRRADAEPPPATLPATAATQASAANVVTEPKQ